ncbi:MAG TPA: RDD family protein [Thermoleophilaceae bacterium]
MTATRPEPHRAQDVARRVHRTPPPVATGPQYVGLVTRTIAFVVDAAIINTVAAVTAAAAALVISIFPVSKTVHSVIVAVGGVLFFAWVIGYFATFWSTTGQTPGNRLMQIRVTRADGGALKPRRALLRVIGLLVAALPLFAGYVPILFNERRRGVGDWIADTVVIRATPPAVTSLNGSRAAPTAP